MPKAAVASPPRALTAEALRAALPFPTDPDFAEEVVEDFRSEELPGVEEADLVAVLAEFWRFAEERWGEKPALRIRRAKGEGGRDLASDLLEIVQPDAPFLVDTIMGEAAEAGAEVRAMFHPVIEREEGRGKERRSLIQVWLAPLAPERGRLLIERIGEALGDVRTAVADFPAMRALMARTIAELAAAAPGDPAHLAEDLAFLAWMDKGHFVFLGARSYDYPRTSEGGYAAEEPLVQPEGSLGVLRDPTRAVLRRANEPAVLSAALRAHLELAEPVVVAKSNLRSRVHRRVMMDYVGVRRYGEDKKPYGEVRFVGLFTAAAYDEPARDTPLLRRKIAQVMERTGFSKGGHNAVRLANILETFPRDELFQMRAEELFSAAVDILHLSDRPRIKLFVRRDPFDRFVSVILFVPRERYDSRLRARAGEMLAKAFRGSLTAYYPSYTDAPLARVHYIIGLSPGRHPAPDLAALEAEIAAAARTWSDELEESASRQSGGASRFATWREAFPVAYRERWDAAEALADIAVMEGLPGADIAVRAFRQAGDSTLRFRLKLYRRGDAPVPLARVLPILDNMGLSALVEEGFELAPILPSGERDRIWIHEFLLEDERGERLVFSEIKGPFEEAFLAVWRGQAESDGFNRLVLELALLWREAALVRALARWRGQSGLDPTAAVQAAAAAENPKVVRLILELFRTKFDPASGLDLGPRRVAAGEMEGRIEAALQNVASLDADRALRRMAGAVTAMTRTNFYQGSETEPAKDHISFKIASGEVAELPAPRPFAEIFVASPRVEGVHLRMGPVARGGLRWSDRRDDFRTEILGLVKAQQVKNAVIVPVGAKGGFFPKLLPRGADGEAIRTEAIGAYEVFLHGLLDLTDNLDGQGRVAHPPGVIVHDGEDPYLVVAADKGTASFSDIANEVAADFGYWLGDAFASGGSAGFDHKAMAITALGAWEAVKRHFRELGKDIQREDFTVVGVGDMSGDVFGNGMLLSEHIKLLAAFDHRHVFLDPAPDPAASFAERKRLFELASSSWDDYDRALISPGGGVWPRTLKSIPLSEEARALLDLKVEAATPAELICAILKARCELLYLGGIGTYVKARSQSQLEVGDKANDPVRVNGADLRCKVVGEGANLGFTQAGRIEYARAGGRIDTDAIDNSAGVDTSDHEVNIKILTGAAIQAGSLKRADRDRLLHAMTGEVAALVLSHNTAQTLALSLL
ncbi:MAG: NAD-glutamate dehydrogenase domain-containing protein, partial [Caulobacteraceae bacterium]